MKIKQVTTWVLAPLIAVCGSVLVVWGQSPQAVGTWTQVGAVADSRVGAASVALADGRTLVSGGSVAGTPTDTVVIYNPADNSFAAAGQLAVARVGHTATLLAGGGVLISGGAVGGAATADLEIFNPGNGTSALVGTMSTARAGHGAARLSDGTVLLVGGSDGQSALATSEVFDPVTMTTAAAGTMSVARSGLSATTLLDGRVLVAGGYDGTTDLASAEIFNPFAQTFEPVPTTLSSARSGHSALLLPYNNGVLLAGGTVAGTAVPGADLFLPAQFPDPYSYGMGAFAATGAMTTARAGAAKGPVSEGLVFMAGGGPADAERYRFATIKTDKDDYAPGEQAVISGSGWQPGAAVTLVFQEDPAVHPDYQLTLTADALGNIYWDQWAPEEHDLNVRFYLLAFDSRSRAQVTFTDSRTITNVTLNGGTSVVVGPGASITAQVSATTDNAGGNQNWRSTGWRIATAPGGVTCVNHPNHDGSGSYSESFSITAPAAGGTYNAYFIAYSNDTCTNQPSNTFTRVSGVTVDAVAPSVVSLDRASGSPTLNDSVTWTVTFSESVTGVDGTDFQVVAGGLTGTPAVTGVSGSGSSYTVTASTGNGTGTLGLNLIDDDTILDTAGNKVGGAGAGNGNFTGQVFDIRRTLTPAITAADKAYDGNTTATVLTRTFTHPDGLPVPADVNVAGGTATFDTKTIGTGKTVTATGLGLAGTSAARYLLSSTSASTTASITPKALTGTFTAADKVYDGTTAASVQTSTVPGVIAPDVVTLSVSNAQFDTRHVGTGKPVSADLALAGADAGNYTVNATATATASITPKALTGSFTVADKVYDGTTAASVQTSTVPGVIAPDVVTLSVSNAQFDTRHVGTGKPVSADLALAGADAGNYTVNATATATASITPKALTGSFTVADKVYDGTTAASVQTSTVPGVIAPDVVTLSVSNAQFDTRHVGTGKPVSADLALAGADAGNYTVNATATATASITPLQVTGSFTAADKIYDGTTAATIATRDVAGEIAGDAVSLAGGAADFVDKHVGTGKTVTATGFTLAGGDSANYGLSASTLTATADITPRTLVVSATGVAKVYDGTTAATVTLGDDRVTGDALTASYGNASFADKHVGAGKPVSVSGIGISGPDASNYTANTTASTTADVTPRTLVVSATGVDRVYNGTTTAAVTLGDDQLAGDIVTASYTSASFADKHVGTGKPVSVSGLSISGPDAGNYAANVTASTTASITPLQATGSFTAADKVYDATTAATISGRDVLGEITGDAVTLTGGTANFADKHVGTGKTVTATGFVLAGSDAGNYSLAAGPLTATADITPLTVTGSFTAASKIFDGNTTATITGRSLSGVIAAEDVTLSGGTAAFASAAVGQNKTVTGVGFALAGAAHSNYALASSTLTTTASITYEWTGFLQPINDTAHQTGLAQSRFKLGQTIPAKFVIRDASGNVVQQVGSPTFSRSGNLGTCAIVLAEEPPIAESPDGVPIYKWQGGQYHYNWSTKGLSQGLYRIYANLADGTQRFVDICLTK